MSELSYVWNGFSEHSSKHAAWDHYRICFVLGIGVGLRQQHSFFGVPRHAPCTTRVLLLLLLLPSNPVDPHSIPRPWPCGWPTPITSTDEPNPIPPHARAERKQVVPNLPAGPRRRPTPESPRTRKKRSGRTGTPKVLLPNKTISTGLGLAQQSTAGLPPAYCRVFLRPPSMRPTIVRTTLHRSLTTAKQNECCLVWCACLFESIRVGGRGGRVYCIL